MIAEQILARDTQAHIQARDMDVFADIIYVHTSVYTHTHLEDMRHVVSGCEGHSNLGGTDEEEE